MKKTLMVFCAHPDDEVFGAGGTAAKYYRMGFRVVPVIFSYGESSHPWLLKEHIVATRVEESRRAGRIIGYSKPVFLGLNEGSFKEEVKAQGTVQQLRKIIRKEKPFMILTHSINDPHPDHRAVYWTIIETIRGFYSRPVYAFDIWNPVSFFNRDSPKLYVDISSTFKLKVSALRVFKSQSASLISLLWSVYVRAILNGLQSKCRYAERFTKIN